MRILRAAVILALFLMVVSLPACGGSGSNNANLATAGNRSSNAAANSNSAKTNIEELAMLVRVPYESEDIVWKEDQVNKKVIAVLRFSPVDAGKIVAEAEAFGTPARVNIPAETWFPGELIAQSEMSGDGVLKGLVYAANGFYQEPYSAGKITRIEGTDYFVLEVAAK